MAGLIQQGFKTLSQYGLRVVMNRTYNYAIFKAKRILSGTDTENIEKFRSLKGKYAGKRIFIIGNGPSLNQMPLYLLKDEYTMCFNRFALMEERINWFPNFYAVTDDLVLRDQAQELNDAIIPKVDYAFFPDLHPSNVSVKKLIDNVKNVLWLHVDKPDFSDNLPWCGINKTVVNAGIQIAAYLGFCEIYLIGVDMTFGDQQIKKANSRNWQATGDDPNHFDPRYFGKGRKYHNPGVAEMLEKFDNCRKFFEPRGVKIFNAGYGGKLEAFPRVIFDELLAITPVKQKDMLEDAIHAIDPSVGLDSFPFMEDGNDDCHFKVSTEEGISMIKNKVTTHVPFGPYDGCYYFMKRKKNIIV